MSIIAIPVSDEVAVGERQGLLDVRASVESLLQRRIETMAVTDETLVCCTDTHPFAQAAHDAFYKHYPLTIGPDDVWFCLAQGFARHVNLNAESFRHRFVRHEGKLKLTVDRPDFLLGRPNPWPEAFASFFDQIAKHVGQPLRDIVVADFSTTTLFHRAATEVAMMDAFQAYFEYEMLCGCGIPEIRLKGAPDDWRDVRRRAAALAPFGLDWWVNALLPVLDQIEATSRGYGDRDFWKSFFRYQSGSRGSEMTGWIHVLFPYLKDNDGKLVRNQYISTWPADYRMDLEATNDFDWLKGPHLSHIPSGIASAPVSLIDRSTNTKHEMRFVAGMFGVSQDGATLSLAPAFGWAVVYDERLPRKPLRRGYNVRSGAGDA